MMNHAPSQIIRPRVFVSSVIEGFEEYRRAARSGIEQACGEPLLVNEDFPAMGISSRNACLDAVDSCDIYIAIIGERGGWTTPSGKLVVEEEYERAKVRKLPILVFLEDIQWDADAQRLAHKLSDYVDGLFRVTFRTPAELEAEVARALTPLIAQFGKPTMDRSKFLNILRDPYRISHETSLRLVLAPERSEEVIDPIRLESREFIDRIYEIGHARQVQLFSYQRPKEEAIENHSLVIYQSDRHGRAETIEEVRLELTESGQVVIDANVTGRVRRGQQNSFLDTIVVAHEDIRTVLRIGFRFTAAFFDEIDKFKRHQRFLYNVALTGLGYRRLVKEPKEQTSYAVNISGSDNPIIAFDDPRVIGRLDLENLEDEIERVIILLVRKTAAP